MRYITLLIGLSTWGMCSLCFAKTDLDLSYTLMGNPLVNVKFADVVEEVERPKRLELAVAETRSWQMNEAQYASDKGDEGIRLSAVAGDQGGAASVAELKQTDAMWFIPQFVRDFNLKLGLNFRLFQGILDNVTIEQREFVGAVPVFFGAYEKNINRFWSWGTEYRHGEVLEQQVNDWRFAFRYTPKSAQLWELGYQQSDSELRDLDDTSEVRVKNRGGYVRWSVNF